MLFRSYGGFASEDDTVEAMYDVFDEYGYAMDTHTGVALAGHMKYREAVEKQNEKDKTERVCRCNACTLVF